MVDKFGAYWAGTKKTNMNELKTNMNELKKQTNINK